MTIEQRELTAAERQQLVNARVAQLRQLEIDELARQQLEAERQEALAAEAEKAQRKARLEADRRRADDLARLNMAIDAYTSKVGTWRNAVDIAAATLVRCRDEQDHLANEYAALAAEIVNFLNGNYGLTSNEALNAIYTDLRDKASGPEIGATVAIRQFEPYTQLQRAQLISRNAHEYIVNPKKEQQDRHEHEFYRSKSQTLGAL